MICRLVASAPAALEAVDRDEAGSSERRQDAAGDGSPEAPAEVRVSAARRCLGSVLAVSETTERSHSCHLQDNCTKHIHSEVRK